MIVKSVSKYISYHVLLVIRKENNCWKSTKNFVNILQNMSLEKWDSNMKQA